MSSRNYSEKALKQINEKCIEYNGEKYSEYEISQIQRRMEREIRSAKREKVAYKTAVEESSGELKATMQKALDYSNSLVRDKQAKIRDFINQTGQQRDYFREQNYGKKIYNIGLQNNIEFRRGNPKGKDLFNIDTNYFGDSITHRNLFNELNKSSIGKSVIEYIKENNINVHISYDIIEDTGHMGHCLFDSMTIFAQNTKSVKTTAKTIIHECTHLKYNIGGCQWAEAVCFAQELLHEKGVLTISDKRDIIKYVRYNYPDFKWRKGGADNG